MIDVQPQFLAGIAAGVPLLACVYTVCCSRGLPHLRMHWPVLVSAVILFAASVTVALLVPDGGLIPAVPMVLYRWVTLPGDNGAVELLWQFDAIVVLFLVMISLTTVSVVWLRGRGVAVEDIGSRRRWLVVVSLLQFATVVMLLSRDWLTCFCCWQLMTLGLDQLDEWSSAESGDTSDGSRRSVVRHMSVAAMLCGLVLYWHGLGTFAFTGVTESVDQRLELASEPWKSGLCFVAAACMRCLLFSLPVTRSKNCSELSDARELSRSIFVFPICTYLVARSLPLLQDSEVMLTAVMSVGATTALLGALRAAMMRNTRQRLSACEASLFGFALFGLGMLTPTATASALLLVIIQIAVMTAMRLAVYCSQLRRGSQSLWLYGLAAMIILSGVCGQQRILAEAALQVREATDGFQQQLLLILHWVAAASLPCLSFALTCGCFELQRTTQPSTSTAKHIDHGALIWGLPITAVAMLFWVIDEPRRLTSGLSSPFSTAVSVKLTPTLSVDAGLVLVLSGVAIAWLYKSTLDSQAGKSRSEEDRKADRLRDGQGPGHRLIGWPLQLAVNICRWFEEVLLNSAGRAVTQRPLKWSADVACLLLTGRVQFYLLSVLLVTALLLLTLSGWGE